MDLYIAEGTTKKMRKVSANVSHFLGRLVSAKSLVRAILFVKECRGTRKRRLQKGKPKLVAGAEELVVPKGTVPKGQRPTAGTGGAVGQILVILRHQ